MIRKYHNHKLQTNPWQRKEEPHNNHETPGRQTKQSDQLSLPHQDDCKTSNVQQKHRLMNKKYSEFKVKIFYPTVKVCAFQSLIPFKPIKHQSRLQMITNLHYLFCLVLLFTSQSTIFQSCRDRSSWVEPVLNSG